MAISSASGTIEVMTIPSVRPTMPVTSTSFSTTRRIFSGVSLLISTSMFGMPARARSVSSNVGIRQGSGQSVWMARASSAWSSDNVIWLTAPVPFVVRSTVAS